MAERYAVEAVRESPASSWYHGSPEELLSLRKQRGNRANHGRRGQPFGEPPDPAGQHSREPSAPQLALLRPADRASVGIGPSMAVPFGDPLDIVPFDITTLARAILDVREHALDAKSASVRCHRSDRRR